MDTMQLQYIVSLGELKSLSRVAQLYNTSYQNIARQIEKLEDELKITLFTRTNKGCFLTNEGDRIYKYAKTLLSSFEYLKETVSLTSIRMGTDKTYIQPSLVEFISRNPNLDITLIPLDHDILIESLLKNRIDFFIDYENVFPKQVRFFTLGLDELVIAMSTNHPYAKRKVLHSSDIDNKTLIVSKILWKNREKIINDIMSNATNCELLFDYTMYDVITKVFSDKALIIIPKSLVNTLIGRVVAIPFENKKMKWGIYYMPENTKVCTLLKSMGIITEKNS